MSIKVGLLNFVVQQNPQQAAQHGSWEQTALRSTCNSCNPEARTATALPEHMEQNTWSRAVLLQKNS